MKIYGIIYKTTCLVNGKIYIGQTIHWQDKNYIGSGASFIESVKKYGRKNFKRRILKICYSQKQLDVWEMIMIKRYDSTNKRIGYNILPGTANNFGSENPSKIPEVQEKIKESKRGKYGGENCYWYGKKLSDETKRKISEKAKKRLSDPTKNGMYGKKHSKATIDKIKNKTIGRIGCNKGKHLSEETKKKLSESLKKYYETHSSPFACKHHSEETKKLLSDKRSHSFL